MKGPHLFGGPIAREMTARLTHGRGQNEGQATKPISSAAQASGKVRNLENRALPSAAHQEQLQQQMPANSRDRTFGGVLRPRLAI